MGYYTTFSGSVSGPQALLAQFQADADEGITFGGYDIPLNDFFETYILDGESVKWYNCADDMLGLSRKYPYLLFTLMGEGEEAGDIWKSWFRNGKHVNVQARIVFEEPGDLDELLPSPDVEKALAELKAQRKREIQARIADLNKELENL